jgi:hypothetical protein
MKQISTLDKILKCWFCLFCQQYITDLKDIMKKSQSFLLALNTATHLLYRMNEAFINATSMRVQTLKKFSAVVDLGWT